MGRPTSVLPRLSVPGASAFTQFSEKTGDFPNELTNMAIIKVELLKLGRRIKAFRKILGRKQKDFCERCGLERSHFDEIERGKRNLTFSNLCQICDGLKCDIATVTEGIPHLKSPSKKQTEE
jgi:DNA-binding Xre family transcriptional regulator